MADPQPAPPDAGIVPAAEQASEAAIRSAKSLGPQLTSIREREQAAVDATKPPVFTPPPSPVTQPTDPKAVWASAAMTMAALGSLFTRQPLTTAMNAAAQVITSYRKGDQAAANAAFETWKVANENYNKAFEYQQQDYRSTIERIGHVADAQAADAKAEVDAKAHAYQDYAMLQQKTWDDKVALYEFRAQLHERQDEQSSHLESEHAAHQAVEAWKKGHPNASAQDVAEATIRIIQQYAPDHPETIQARQGAEDRQQQHLQTSQMGKNYEAVVNKMNVIEGVKRMGDNLSNIDHASLADAFTQIINGGRAIRGFQMKMLSEHAGIWNNMDIALAQLKQGGSLSPAMVKEMIQISEEAAQAVDSQYGSEIARAQVRARDMNLDPNAVVPNDYDPNAVRNQLGLAPYPPVTPEAVTHLKQDQRAGADLDFDEIFGPGAAVKARAGLVGQ